MDDFSFVIAQEENGAVFDITGKYRYQLWRIWNAEKPIALFVMLNPSTANADSNDPTIRRCIGFAKAWGCGGIKVVNLFALVSSDPKKLISEKNAVGEENDLYIAKSAREADLIILAWGTFKEAKERADQVIQNLLCDYDLFCLGIAKDGSPKHPLYLSKSTMPSPYGS